jgi:hypothetical protein
MSERTAASLAKLDALLPKLPTLAPSKDRDHLIDEAEALRRAVSAFHMEAIRFRMHNVERLIRLLGDDPALRQLFDELRHELETAGFHTRSHAAP